MGGGAARARPTRADVRRLPRLYAAAGYACFVGRAEAATAHAHRATELEQRPGYESCEPGYATFIEALGQVYCGNLDRYVELTRDVAALPGSSRAFAVAAYVDGLQSAGRVEEALELTETALTAARELGNPYWIAYTLWIVGLALSKADPRPAEPTFDSSGVCSNGSRAIKQISLQKYPFLGIESPENPRQRHRGIEERRYRT